MAGKPVVIRAVARALRLLEAMNQRSYATLAELSALTGLPKPTVFRLLATLQSEGYVLNEGHLGQYRTTAKTRALGAGYGEQSRLVDAAGPILSEATTRTKWPLALGVREGEMMVVRYSTMPLTPLAVHATTLGHRLGLTQSAMGTAHLAFCDEAQRSALLASISLDAAMEEALQAELVRTRRRGYALRLPREAPGATATVALPVMLEGKVAGVVSITLFGSAMTEKTLAGCVPVLQQVAADITAKLESTPPAQLP